MKSLVDKNNGLQLHAPSSQNQKFSLLTSQQEL